jgi:WD40 repeat protein
MTKELYNIETNCDATNKICFDPSGTILGAAAANGTIKLIAHSEKSRVVDLTTQDESIHAICFDKTGEYLVTSGNDGSFRIFQ